MAIAKSTLKFIRIAPFKVRRIANEIVGKKVLTAESYLSVLTNKGALAIKKAVHSARTNYMNANKNASEENLIVSKILVDQGPSMKRFHPISRGRVSSSIKSMCHIYVDIPEIGGNE